VLGFVVGVLACVGYIGHAIGIAESDETLLSLSLGGLATLLLAVLAGLLFTKTVGIAAMFAMLGAAVAAPVALITGGAVFAPVFLLHAVGWFVVQQVLAAWVGRRGGQGLLRP
jgi:hypothetical protein